jgi:hypothetical protein
VLGVGLYYAIGIVLVTALTGMFLKWLLENFLTEREASISSFSLALGNSLGLLLLDMDFDYVATTEKIGSAIGLVILWWLLFKRKRTHA